MKKLGCLLLAVLLTVGALASCTGRYDKSPDEYTGIRWAARDYSFVFYPDEDCTGTFKFEDKTYPIKIEFATASLTARDTSNSGTRLFIADWMYEDDSLFIYNIQYNTSDYKELEDNYSEFYNLYKEETEAKK